MTALLTTGFPAVLNMSLTAIPVILAVLLARLVLKRTPKIFSYLLWAVVLFRLLCPVSLTAGFSLLGAIDAPVVPSGSSGMTTVEFVQPLVEPPKADGGVPTVPPAQLTPATPSQPLPEPAATVTAMDILPWIWLAGMAVLAGYSLWSLLRLHRRLICSLHLRENIYLSDEVGTAFVTGVFRTRIYLPSDMGESEQTYILAHERHHIRRGDPVWKLLTFTALVIHWFNPFVWLSFVLAARDMEMSCDEAVVRKLGADIRVDYSQSLLNLAAGRRLLSAPLAFGEGDTRSRITNVLNWKRPRTWVVVLSAVACVALVAACASNPERKGQYEDFEGYVEQTLDTLPKTLRLMTWDLETNIEEDVDFPVLNHRISLLEETGQQANLDPEGTLTVWRYATEAQLDLLGYDPDLVGVAGGSYTDEEGVFHGAGQQVAVTRTYPDGSLDVLEDTLDIDSTGFLDYHNSWDDALYDWYVRENGLEDELPLLVQDWQEQIHYPDGAYRGNYPVNRVDGDGRYFYAPYSAWNHSAGFWEDRWESAYGTGSFLTVDSFTQSIEDQQLVCKKQGYIPVESSFRDGNWYIWASPRSPETVGRYYFFDKPDGGCWRVWIQWDPEAIDSHWSEFPKLEPQVVQMMAESFRVDDRIHAPSGLREALASLRWTTDWTAVPCELWQQDEGQLAQGVPAFLPDRLVNPDLQLQDWEEEPAEKDWTFQLRWAEQPQSLSFRASDEIPGVVEVQYHGRGPLTTRLQRGTYSDPELYVWLMAAREYPADGIRLVDVDRDGFLESWFYGPNLCLYDFYDGRLQQPKLPTYEARFVTGTRNAARLSEEHRCHLISQRNGEPHLYAYRDGEFTDLGTWDDAEANLQNTAEVVYRDKLLETTSDPMSYQERLDWCRSQGKVTDYVWPSRLSVFDNGSILYLQELAGTAHRGQYQLMLRFPDGEQAQLPLPMPDPVHILPPEEWGGYGDNGFLYQVTVPLDDSGATETHHYQVDTDTRAITLLVER